MSDNTLFYFSNSLQLIKFIFFVLTKQHCLMPEAILASLHLNEKHCIVFLLCDIHLIKANETLKVQQATLKYHNITTLLLLYSLTNHSPFCKPKTNCTLNCLHLLTAKLIFCYNTLPFFDLILQRVICFFVQFKGAGTQMRIP